jgi:hypothetical protein
MRPSVRRLGSVVATAALVASGSALLAAPASAVTDPRPGAVGSNWLVDQLTNGLIHNAQYDFDDIGLTIDAGLALAAYGGANDSITDALAPKIFDGYAQSDEYDFNPPYAFIQTGHYAGQAAKALVYAQTVGKNPTTWAGSDLVAATEARVIAGGNSDGRIADDSSYGDNANVIGQAFAASGLEAAASAKAASVLAFLLKQQCSAGYFRLFMNPDKTSIYQTCEDGRTAGQSAPDPDATSTALRLLAPIAETNPAAARAVGKAEAWLLSRQNPDGSFNGGTSTNVPNTNSTGLAGWALGDLGDDEAASRAAAWIRMHQVDEVGTCTSAAPIGAIAYDDNALAKGVATGISDTTADQWRRAAAQSLPALKWAPYDSVLLTFDPPTSYLRAGSTASLVLTGIEPGDKICLTGLGAPVRAAADVTGKATVHVVLPAGTANRSVSIVDRFGFTATAPLKLLGVKTFAVKVSKARVKRGKKVTVTVTGAAPGEKVQLYLRGSRVNTGSATASGTLTRTFNVGRKLGKARITAYGQFPKLPRAGHASVRVIR